MSHRASPRFWRSYAALSPPKRKLADDAFKLLREDSSHPSLRLKKVGAFWSVRIDRDHRALGIADELGIIWVWIGDHADYERLIR